MVLRPTDRQPPYEVMAVTADPAEGEAFTEAGNDLVDTVAMPAEIRDALEAFVAEHHVARPFFKRQRDRADPAEPRRGDRRPQRRARAMSDDNFIARWSRLKREAESERRRARGRARRRRRRRAACGRAGAAAAEKRHGEPPFDPATLPSIDSIVAGTDIRAFLQKGVPAEMTKAALRRAWSTDPAIRDFIEIAENQWDFTDPTSIPGFGPLGASDNVRNSPPRRWESCRSRRPPASASARQGRSRTKTVPRRRTSRAAITTTGGGNMDGRRPKAHDQEAALLRHTRSPLRQRSARGVPAQRGNAAINLIAQAWALPQ